MTDPYCNRCGIPHPPGHCQRDPDATLRDRIAAAIKAVDAMPSNDFDPYAEMADAVINTLGMTREHGYGTTYPNLPVTDLQYTRYVTDWTAE